MRLPVNELEALHFGGIAMGATVATVIEVWLLLSLPAALILGAVLRRCSEVKP